MEVDENIRQTFIHFDPAPRSENESVPIRVPDYFL